MSRSERETGGMLALTGTKVQNPALVEMGEVRGIALGPELKKGQRGAIIADDFGLSGNDESGVVKVLNPNVDTYRMALLFNEVLDLPAFGGFAACAPGDPFGLEDMGHVRRSEYLMNGVVRFPEVQAVPILTYEGLNSREPGAWTIWHEPEYDPIPAVFSDLNFAVKLAL